MSVEKISSDEMNSLKKKIEVDAKLPAAESLIAELAAPFMAEAMSVQQSPRNYIVSEDGATLIVPEMEDEPKIKPMHEARFEKNNSVLDANIEKLSKLPDAETYVSRLVKKGISREQAMQEYIDRLLKYVHGGKEISGMSDEELSEFDFEGEK